VREVGGSVLPWLLVTTSNLARNQRRAARRYRRFLAALPRSVDVPDAADSVLASATLGLDPVLLDALRSLRGPDLHLLTLVAIEDYSIADAATVIGISEPAAKTRLHRIRTRLRDQLDPEFRAGLTPRAEP
jgi:RNA polymerase sigma-70 factor (ECF subfamily)